MSSYALSHLADHLLSRELSTLVAQDWAATARLLACLAEFDDRKLYLPAGYPSMFAYCVRVLRMSEDSAFKRIRAARVAREFPAVLPALAEGRLHLSAVILLAPHMRPDNAGELLAMAMHKTKAEIELLLVERFPQPDVPTLVRALPAPTEREAAPATTQALQPQAACNGLALATAACENLHELAPGPVVPSDLRVMPISMEPLGPAVGSASESAVHSTNTLPTATTTPPRAKLTPLSPRRFSLQLTVDQETYEQLRHAQALLGHAVPSGDLAEVLKRALDALVRDLEKRKFAKTSRVRPRRGTADSRYVPAEIRRAVWKRDGGQCTFVSDSGHRCEARTRLEFDHIEPVARGGRTTAANTRLRCRAHNQYAAERAFGAGFMREKREMASHMSAEKRAQRCLAPAIACRIPPPATGTS